MSYGYGIFWIFGLLAQIAQLVAGIFALKISKAAGWLMISAPICSLASYILAVAAQDWISTSSGPEAFSLIFGLLPDFAQTLFLAGVFVILLQAKALKKRAEEQQLLLDDITSRQ